MQYVRIRIEHAKVGDKLIFGSCRPYSFEQIVSITEIEDSCNDCFIVVCKNDNGELNEYKHEKGELFIKVSM